MKQSEIAALAIALAMGLSLAACGESSTPQQEETSSAPAKPDDKIRSLRPADQAALFNAFDAHDKAVNDAPNEVAKIDIRKVEDPKLCKTIENFKEFHNWTAQVVAVSIPSDKPDVIQITVTLNGSLAGYLATAQVASASPLYSKIKGLKEGLNGDAVAVSGTVLKAKTGLEALAIATDTTGVALECAGFSNFDVTLTEIDQL